MQPSQPEFIQHILSECIYLTKESEELDFDDFLEDERLIRALCRSLEIIGEASKRVHPDFKAKYSLVPWREMSSIRNVIIHNYFGVDYDVVWGTIKNDIPFLKEWMEVIQKNENWNNNP